MKCQGCRDWDSSRLRNLKVVDTETGRDWSKVIETETFLRVSLISVVVLGVKIIASKSRMFSTLCCGWNICSTWIKHVTVWWLWVMLVWMSKRAYHGYSLTTGISIFHAIPLPDFFGLKSLRFLKITARFGQLRAPNMILKRPGIQSYNACPWLILGTFD